jgi:hypothetical protein
MCILLGIDVGGWRCCGLLWRTGDVGNWRFWLEMLEAGLPCGLEMLQGGDVGDRCLEMCCCTGVVAYSCAPWRWICALGRCTVLLGYLPMTSSDNCRLPEHGHMIRINHRHNLKTERNGFMVRC